MDLKKYIIIWLSLFFVGCNLSDPEKNKPINTVNDVKCFKYFSYNPKFNLCFEGGSFSCDNNISFSKEKNLCLKQINTVFYRERRNHLEDNYKLNILLKEKNIEDNFIEIKKQSKEKFKDITKNKNKIFDNYYKYCFKDFQYAYCDNYTNLLNKLNRDVYTIFDDIEILLNQKYENY